MSNQHGGKRPGAGRPATGRKPTRSIRMTDKEYELVKKFLAELRSNNDTVISISLSDEENEQLCASAERLGETVDERAKMIISAYLSGIRKKKNTASFPRRQQTKKATE
ncbi:hypothetical protein [Alicyclobacillus acidoterrestris]|uniref:Uncharacterized protein n=1 Tax=Alicyclobacillus acidoterrestris (strain ATCC 49025 / DSM 3922 / CIP 106132 / NCIMB 13137 / GD3B) TaxID=1356854 RepID=T0D863_ALIAG|nr:hypothetical protein [Alicyclobacillus acidoterrestris]EPZ47702.1 hypothetical protein N007_05460 [Alicyclobacillus acidoterrestris ATCC 49025]UNO47983.1 hypothetical protein K1I37_15015 [Alicyclobacillus acidoterrestris]